MDLFAQNLKSFAQSLGFARVGITSGAPPQDIHRYQEWVAKGYAGNMGYLTESSRMQKRGDLSKILPGIKSVIVCSLSYAQEKPILNSNIKFARYGWGLDYHDFVKIRLEKLVEWIQKEKRESFSYLTYVDTGPVLERSLAERAGVGWIGKNTMVMSEETGSYVYLGEILTTLELPLNTPAVNRCGTCTRCLDACPTKAFAGPYQLDAQKCISYQTLENRKEEIPASLLPHLNSWVAGCDICQEVCPWNHEPLGKKIEEIQPLAHSQLTSEEILSLTPNLFEKLFQNTAFERMGLTKLQKNVRSILDGQ